MDKHLHGQICGPCQLLLKGYLTAATIKKLKEAIRWATLGSMTLGDAVRICLSYCRLTNGKGYK